MPSFRVSLPTTIRISDLKDKTKEVVARQFDAGSKGYLTTQEAFALYASQNNDVQARSMDEIIAFLGGAQHPMVQHHLDHGEVLSLPFHAHDWKGDFSIPGLGAGNVRVGGYYNWERPTDPKAAAFLFDLNLVDLAKVDRDVVSATLVIGPAGFAPEAGSAQPDEAVDVPLTLATLEGHQRWERAGGGFQPEQKFLAAAIDIDDLRALSAGAGLSFYVRLETTSGTKYINKDGVPGRNFDIAHGELQSYAGV